MRYTKIVCIVSLGCFVLVLTAPAIRAQQALKNFSGESKALVPAAWTRAMLASAIAKGQPNVPVLIAARRGETDAVCKLVRDAGGTVELDVARIGYVRSVMPTAKVAWLVEQSAVVDLAIDAEQHFSDGLKPAPVVRNEKADLVSAEQRAKDKEPQEAAKRAAEVRDAARTFLPPEFITSKPGFDPNEPMEATDWLKAHPTWDGRGVTLAILEGVADLSNPAMQTARDRSGNVVPKVKHIFNPTNLEGANPVWVGEVHFEKQTLSDGTKCPEANSHEKVGTWTALVGHTKGGRPEYCVSWNVERKTARIDTNRDGNFEDEVSLSDYNVQPGYVKVYADPKDKDGQYATTYLVYDETFNKVYLRVTPDNHPSMTATAATGTGFMGTTLGGVAPGAQLAFVAEGPHWSGLIEGFWTAANDPDIDLISASTGLASFPNDAQPLFELFLSRISQETGKPIVIAARNHGPAFEQAQSNNGILTVGGYASAEEIAAFSIDDEHLASEGQVVPYSSGGPAMNGGFGADVLTPIPGVTGWNCGNIEERPTVIFVGREYKLPRCWGVGGGTSVATPRAAGAIALLLSAAKQTGLHVTPEMIRTALIVSAKPIPSEGMYRQGAGLVQVSRAWDALQEIAKAPRVVVHSRSRAISPLYPYWWRGANEGESIYFLRNMMEGEKRQLPLDLWVESATADSKFTLSLVGDTGNFTIPSSVNLSRRRQLMISFRSTKPGNYSAVLLLHQKGKKYPVAEIPMFVSVTPDPEELKKGLEITKTISAENQEFTVFNLPKGAHHVVAQLSAEGNIQPVVSYVIDDAQPGHFPTDTLIGNTQVGSSYIPEIGEASILGVNVNVSSHYPMPCCNGSYTLRLRVSEDPVTATASDERIDLQPPSAGEAAREMTATVKGGNEKVRLAANCPHCKENSDYELYVFKSFKDRKGDTQQGLWTYWPVFDGKWSDVVSREKEDSTWKFIVMRKDSRISSPAGKP